MSNLTNYLPNISLTNELNETSNFHDIIQDKTVVLNMFYSNCQIKCIPLAKLLKRVNILLKNYISKNNIIFMSITLDSLNDTVQDLDRFKSHVYDSQCQNWHFYTGIHNQVESLRYKLGMYNPEPEIDAIKPNHSGGFVIFNTTTGFIKHTESFDNPIDIARKVVQNIPRNFYTHSYDLKDLNFSSLSDAELFENTRSINSLFTVPFLPDHIQTLYEYYGEKQRNQSYDPIPNPRQCCCKNKL